MSALIDDELQATEMAPTLDRISMDAELRERWSRLYLIGDVLRGEETRAEYHGIADRVRERLDKEAVQFHPAAARRKRMAWLKPVGGAAIAASVAVTAVVYAPRLINPQEAAVPGLATTRSEAVPAARLRYAERSGMHWNRAQPAVESRLNSYLVNHQEYAPVSGMRGILPYATFVSYDAHR